MALRVKRMDETAGQEEAERWTQRAAFEREVHGPSRRDVLPAGNWFKESVEIWTPNMDGNCRIALTGERRDHILQRDPEIKNYPERIISTMPAPAEVHKDVDENLAALFFQPVSSAHSVGAVVRMRPLAGAKKHSFITAHLVYGKHVRDRAERSVWPTGQEEPPGGTVTPT
ncbi:MAG: hypothetical protein ACOX2L_00665 [Anaerolineae bacterium]|jgi:hypothetical protein|nr:hypothetical protein [Chloroflexota bacterium]